MPPSSEAAPIYDRSMPLGIGRHLLFRHLLHGTGIVVIIAVIASIVLVRLWPQITTWIERGRRR